MLALALLPLGTFAVTAYAAYPRGPVTAPVRLTVVRSGVLVCGLCVASVEALSAGHLIGMAGVVSVWSAALVVAGVVAGWRYRAARPDLAALGLASLRARWGALRMADRIMLIALAGLVLAELTLALVSAPNTYDSQTYHLPRVEHWVAQHSVNPYPVRIHRQITYPPGAEYLLLHLRILVGGDLLAASVQWAAGLLALAGATRMAAQLGGGRRAQILTAFVLGTTPAVVLESSSTQVDLVMAGWAVALATLVLDGIGRKPTTPPGPLAVILLGVVTGLIAVTKSTGMPLAAMLLAWWALAWLRRGAGPRRGATRKAATIAGVVASTLAILALTSALTGPYLWRTNALFGNPLGPEYLRQSIAVQKDDPASILINGLRQAHTALDTPIRPLSRASADAIIWLAHQLGADPQDPATTFEDSTFPSVAWYPSEGRAALPLQAIILLCGVMTMLVRPGLRNAGSRRVLAVMLVLAVGLHAATVKWSPWGNRLTLHLVVLAAPLAGLWMARLTRGARRPAGVRLCGALTTVVLAASGISGWMSAAYGWPRRLVGHQSVFVVDRWHSLFVTRPEWADDYAAVGKAVRATGARRIGIVQGNDTWEYPWWLLFKGRDLVAIQSQLPGHGGAEPASVDAIVCSVQVETCRAYTPAGWSVHQRGTLTYMVR